MRAIRSRWVAGHWFPPFSVETQIAYYVSEWLPPGGIEGEGQTWEVDWRPYGGYLREAPHSTIRDVNDSNAVRYAKEIAAMKAAGYDGCTIDLLSNSTSSNSNWARTLAFQDACAAAGDFDFLPMPDGTASFVSAGSSAVADHLNTLFTRPARTACYKLDGYYGYAPFMPEAAASGAAAERAFWDAVNSRLAATHGLTTRQWNCYQSEAGLTSTGGAPNYNDATYIFGHGRWGVANPEAAANLINEPADFLATFGKPWMHYARPADQRYIRQTGLGYDESDHTRLYRNCWRAAITHSPRGVQLTTHNDYRESSATAPSRFGGYAWLDLTSFYAAWYKLQARQPIVRDTVYLSWRIHRSDKTSGFTSPTYDTANLMPLKTGTPVYTVESLCFLTAPATVKQVVAGVTTTTSVTQAMIDAQWDGVVPVKAPHPVDANGALSTWVERGGVEVPGTRVDVSAADGVTATPLVQDLQYRIRSSRR